MAGYEEVMLTGGVLGDCCPHHASTHPPLLPRCTDRVDNNMFIWHYMPMATKRKEVKKLRGTYVDLPEDLYLWLKHHAVDQNMSLKGVVQKALEEYKAKKGDKR
jgi:hypothetical protein